MAQKLKFGNGTWANKEGSTLAYNDENNNYKPLPFSFTRNSIATRVNKEGLIEVVGNDKPRIDYTDSADGVLLLEPSRTNVAFPSENFSVFGSGSSTIVTNQSISPDGTMSADKIYPNSNGSYIGKYLNIGASTTGVVSCFVKQSNKRYAILGTDNNATYSCIFDLQTGTVSSQATNYTAKIENYGNGWYRISAAYTSSAAAAYPFIGVADATDGSVTVDNTNGLFIWGFQYELNSSYPTSYIPTSGSSVTRAAETANGAGNSEVFNDSEGVLMAEISALDNDGTDRFISLTDGSNDNRVLFGYRSISNQVFARIEGNNSASVDLTTVLSDTKINAKITISYDSSYNYKMFVNGFLVDSAVGSDNMVGLDRIDFTDASGGSDFYGKTKEIGYYDEILTDSELEYLTSYRSLSELVKELNLNTL